LVLQKEDIRGQNEEAGPEMCHEKAGQHHLRHDEEQDGVQGTGF